MSSRLASACAVVLCMLLQALPVYAQSAEYMDNERLVSLMENGRRAIESADYPAAIRNYTLVLRQGDTPYAQDAQEYLGVARERNGEDSHAISEYRRYLATWPQADNAPRVRQRLDALLLPALALPDRVDPTPAALASDSDWEVYAGLSQYYRRDEVDFDGQGSDTIQSAVLTDVDLLTRYAGSRFDVESRITLGDYRDLLSDDEGVGSDTRFYNAYVDVEDMDTGLSGRFGRQTLNSSGVPGRFDGAHVSWQFDPLWRVNVIGGEPIYSLTDSGGSDRSFYAVSIDRFDIADLFDLSVYFNAQEVDGIDDREAVGVEVNFYGDRSMLVSYLDYDTGYNKLNSFVTLANWSFNNDVTINASFDYRQAPFLQTENALFGTNADSIDELRETFSENEIRELAEDNTGDFTSVTLGISAPLRNRFQINADVTYSDFSGLDDEPDPDADLYYSLSLVGYELLTEGDTSIFTLRYYDGFTTTTTSASADYRVPVTERLRVNPRLVVSYRDLSRGDSSEWLVAPQVRLFYELRRRLRLEFDLGYRMSSLDSNGDSIDTNSWFLYTGYRADF